MQALLPALAGARGLAWELAAAVYAEGAGACLEWLLLVLTLQYALAEQCCCAWLVTPVLPAAPLLLLLCCLYPVLVLLDWRGMGGGVTVLG